MWWFSNVLANTIKKLFGDYIEGLDTISLPIWTGMLYALFSYPHFLFFILLSFPYHTPGDVVLENLTINKKQLTTPDLPIEVVQGILFACLLFIY